MMAANVERRKMRSRDVVAYIRIVYIYIYPMVYTTYIEGLRASPRYMLHIGTYVELPGTKSDECVRERMLVEVLNYCCNTTA